MNIGTRKSALLRFYEELEDRLLDIDRQIREGNFEEAEFWINYTADGIRMDADKLLEAIREDDLD